MQLMPHSNHQSARLGVFMVSQDLDPSIASASLTTTDRPPGQASCPALRSGRQEMTNGWEVDLPYVPCHTGVTVTTGLLHTDTHASPTQAHNTPVWFSTQKLSQYFSFRQSDSATCSPATEAISHVLQMMLRRNPHLIESSLSRKQQQPGMKENYHSSSLFSKLKQIT